MSAGIDAQGTFLRFPSGRGAPLATIHAWLAGKRKDDGAEGLWRVHDKLYDLTEFMARHPGGSEWIEFTRGTDITEVFESSHLGPTASSMLKKFFVRDAKEPRNCQFTFKPEGFYCTLKQRAYEVLKKVGGQGPSPAMLRMHTSLTGLVLIISFVMAVADDSRVPGFALMAGSLLGLLVVMSHNFYHQSNNYHMYAWDLSMFSSLEWRLSHGLSHHPYPNTVNDFEVTAFEPYMCFLPYKGKSLFSGLASTVLGQVLIALSGHLQFAQRVRSYLSGALAFRREELLRFAHLFALLVVRVVFLHLVFGSCRGLTAEFLTTLYRWTFMEFVASYVATGVGLAAAHHHPTTWHAGDDINVNDWGVHQICATRDRPDIDPSDFWATCTYGRHVLHHLFPTVDHSKLPLLQPVLESTCQEFGVDLPSKRGYSSLEMWIGGYQQLFRNKPRSDAYITPKRD